MTALLERLLTNLALTAIERLARYLEELMAERPHRPVENSLIKELDKFREETATYANHRGLMMLARSFHKNLKKDGQVTQAKELEKLISAVDEENL